MTRSASTSRPAEALERYALATGGWFWETDADHRFVYMSESVVEYVGVRPDWHYGKTREEIAAELGPAAEDSYEYGSRSRFDDPALRAEEWARHSASIDAHLPFRDFIYPRRGPAGIQWLKTSGFPVFDTNGKFTGYQGVAADAGPLVIAERRRVRAETLLEEAIGSLPEGFVLYDSDERLVICNDAYRNAYQITGNIIPGERFEDILRDGLRRGQYPSAIGHEEAWLAERLARFRNPAEPIEQQLPNDRWLRVYESKTPTGGTVGYRVDISALKSQEAQTEAARLRTQQLNEALQLEKTSLERRVRERTAELEEKLREIKVTSDKLTKSEARFRLVTENVADFICLFSPDGKVIYASPSLQRIFLDESSGKILGHQIGDNVHPDDREDLLRVFASLKAVGGKAEQLQYRLVLPSGDIRWIDVNGRSISDPRDSRIQNVLMVGHDITDRRNADMVVRQLQTQEAIGQLTGGLAHDFNNLLGVVVGNLDLALEGAMAGDEVTREKIETARAAALQGAAVTRSLLAVARRQALDVEPRDLNEMITSLLPLIRTSIGASVTLNMDLCKDALVSRLDSSGLNNVVLNLAINARDAMERSGNEKVLTVRTRSERIDTVPTGAVQWLTPGWYGVIEIADTGVGMSEAVLAQAFAPFFTTKERGKGTGLGLAMVRGYAEQLGGTSTIESALGAGTTVKVYLPLDSDLDDSSTQREHNRLEALRATGLLDSAPDLALERIVGQARELCEVPIAMISLVDQHRQWFKARIGMDIAETSRDASFCAHAIQRPNETMIVRDALQDDRFASNPLVLRDPKIRFYAGVPFRTPEGFVLGTLCVLDRVPRTLTESQVQGLEGLAQSLEALIPGLAGDTSTPEQTLPQTGHILVVDDEIELCEIASAWLESLGYRVETVHSPADALDRLRSGRFDALFTDVVMPGSMDGIELAREAMRLYPGMRVVLASGYASALAAKSEEIPGPVLNKPYRKPDLARYFPKL